MLVFLIINSFVYESLLLEEKTNEPFCFQNAINLDI